MGKCHVSVLMAKEWAGHLSRDSVTVITCVSGRNTLLTGAAAFQNHRGNRLNDDRFAREQAKGGHDRHRHQRTNTAQRVPDSEGADEAADRAALGSGVVYMCVRLLVTSHSATNAAAQYQFE